MNNTQVAVLAASMRTGGRNMNSVADMLEDSRVIEAHLDEQDRIKDRSQARHYRAAVWNDVLTSTQTPDETPQAENKPGSFEALVPPVLRGAH